MDKKTAFAALTAEFGNNPAAFLDGSFSISCTLVGEYLMDHCQVEEEDAFEWAYEWAEEVEASL